MKYIYINYNDLKEEVQEEIKDLARQEVEKETTQEEADNLRMELEDLITERIDKKLLEFSYEGKFEFNI